MQVDFLRSLKGPIAVGLLLAIAYLSVGFLLWWRQTRFIFYPSPTITQTPADFQLSYEEVWLNVTERERLHGWWIPAANPETSPGTILYLHGNGINIGANVNHSYRLHSLGFSVFVFDYRGYGWSEGAFPSEQSVYQDAQRAWEYLVNERQIEPSQIYLYGHSLGGAIAIELATHQPDAADLIVESSFTSLRDMVDYQYPIFNLLPVDWLLTNRFDSKSKVRSLSLPLLLIHGTGDLTVPAEMSQRLYEIASPPKKLFLVPDADHTNVASLSGESYLQTIRNFIESQEKSSEFPVRKKGVGS